MSASFKAASKSQSVSSEGRNLAAMTWTRCCHMAWLAKRNASAASGSLARTSIPARSRPAARRAVARAASAAASWPLKCSTWLAKPPHLALYPCLIGVDQGLKSAAYAIVVERGKALHVQHNMAQGRFLVCRWRLSAGHFVDRDSTGFEPDRACRVATLVFFCPGDGMYGSAMPGHELDIVTVRHVKLGQFLFGVIAIETIPAQGGGPSYEERCTTGVFGCW